MKRKGRLPRNSLLLCHLQSDAADICHSTADGSRLGSFLCPPFSGNPQANQPRKPLGRRKLVKVRRASLLAPSQTLVWSPNLNYPSPKMQSPLCQVTKPGLQLRCPAGAAAQPKARWAAGPWLLGLSPAEGLRSFKLCAVGCFRSKELCDTYKPTKYTCSCLACLVPNSCRKARCGADTN